MEDGPSPRAASQCASNRIKPHQTTCVTAARLFEWMGSFTARQPPRAVWSVEECTRFAALREYELLQLLSRDKKALTTARRLGLSLSHPQPQPPSRSTAVGGGPVMPNAPAPAAALVSNGPNARQRRSAARSAQRHAARRAQMCSRSMLAIIFTLCGCADLSAAPLVFLPRTALAEVGVMCRRGRNLIVLSLLNK